LWSRLVQWYFPICGQGWFSGICFANEKKLSGVLFVRVCGLPDGTLRATAIQARESGALACVQDEVNNGLVLWVMSWTADHDVWSRLRVSCNSVLKGEYWCLEKIAM
jgi:hypothetical protein